jgi:hypothetical protein
MAEENLIGRIQIRNTFFSQKAEEVYKTYLILCFVASSISLLPPPRTFDGGGHCCYDWHRGLASDFFP